MRILSVVGTRPQFIKAAAVSRALRAMPGVTEIVADTGQHTAADMADVFIAELAMTVPAHRLGVHGGSHAEMTGRMMVALERTMCSERPDWVLVYGDTNSTLAAALAAAKLNLRIAHVEAGLRSFNRRMPEETNRIVTDRISTLLFCPTRASVANLAREGMVKGVHHTGDVMYDAARHAAGEARRRSDILKRLGVAPGAYAVATVHRAENTDEPRRLSKVLEWLKDRARGHAVVLPAHPRLRQAVERAGLAFEPLLACPPVGYFDMAALLAGAIEVYTDSGGLQKDAYFHRKPCVTLREETEWVETVECGWNRLWTVPEYRERRIIDDYGDGAAARRIAELLISGD